MLEAGVCLADAQMSFKYRNPLLQALALFLQRTHLQFLLVQKKPIMITMAGTSNSDCSDSGT
jgi:hypothetical protein